MRHPFADLMPEYVRLLSLMQVLPEKLPLVSAVANKLLGSLYLPRYQAVQSESGVPVLFIAGVDERESSANPRLALGQGDPWGSVSTHVPRGLGPFASWKAAAIFYLHREHVDDNTAVWSWPYLCWKAECWNGFGYRAHGIHSPYLWAGTNVYRAGKYTSDGHFDPGAVDHQLGLIPVAARMAQLMPELGMPGMPGQNTIPTAAPMPVPAGVGAPISGHDVKWLQAALNKAFLKPGEELAVDGVYGRRTRSAVWAFQATHGLHVDGLWGPETDGALTRAITGAS